MSRSFPPHRRTARAGRVVSPALLAQSMVMLAGVAMLTLAPPTDGAMLLVPLPGTSGGRALDIALAHGATVLASGPWTGTTIVRVGRGGRAGITLGDGVLMLAAAPLLCTAPGAGRGRIS